MKLIDTHSHPYFAQFDADREKVLESAFTVCEAIVSVGAGIPESREAVKLAQDNPRIFASVGIHPHDIFRDKLEDLKPLAFQPKTVAIGECGLDYKSSHQTSLGQDKEQPVDKEKQKEVFTYQISLANELKLPVIIHARECWEDLIPLLKKLRPNSGLVHSWTGGLKEAEEIFELGLHISFSGMLTYPANEHIRLVAKMAPSDRILVETDAPFLPPQPVRGQRNEPSNVKMVAEKLAEIREVSLEEIASVTSANAKRLLSLPTL